MFNKLALSCVVFSIIQWFAIDAGLSASALSSAGVHAIDYAEPILTAVSQSKELKKATKFPDDNFYRRVNRIKSKEVRNNYIRAIQGFRDIPLEEPKYKAIVERMLQHQDKVFDLLGNCENTEPRPIRLSKFYQISERTYIFQRVCFLAAYNINYVFYLYTETPNSAQVKPLKLLTFSRNDRSGKLVREESNVFAGLSLYEENTRELEISAKYRGVGDCGISGKYRFENNNFALKEFLADFDCDGKIELKKIYP